MPTDPIFDATAVEVEKESGWKPPLTAQSAAAQAQVEKDGALVWCRHFFPYLFSRPFTAYQERFWEWGWQIEPDKYYRPRIECEPRGVGKSTNAEAWVTSLIARKRRQMVGYVSLNEQKATKHFESIKTMLESDSLLETYPHCRPKVQKLKDIAAQWSRDAIVTESGAMVVPLTLLGSSRGWKSSTGARFDVIVLDDIDELGQSADFTKKLIDLLKGEILAAGDDNTIVLMPQNLIYRDSICSQILDHRADILSDRVFCGPFPLLKWYDAEKVPIEGDETGAMEWIVTAGEAFDPAISIGYAQKLLNKFGKVTFDRECQQEVTKIEDDKDFREWDEKFHIITASEFRRTMEAYGESVWNSERQCLQIPPRWQVGLGFDWGTTRKHPSVVAFNARPPIVSPLSDCHFAFAELVMPKFPLDSHEEAPLVSPGRVAAAVADILKDWNVLDSQITFKLMSHEASATLNTMAVDLQDDIKQYWGKWKAQKGSGIPQIQNLLEINRKLPHPFRRYPQGYKIDGQDVGTQPLRGRPRRFLIVADGQGELLTDQVGKLFVVGAKDRHGFARARFEIPLYSYRNQGDKKIDDDWVDADRGVMNLFGPPVGPESREEKIERALPEALKMEVIQQMPTQADQDAAIMRRQIEQEKVVKQMDMPLRNPAVGRFARR